MTRTVLSTDDADESAQPTAFGSRLPSELYYKFYQEAYPDLNGLSDAILADHYERHGRREGRIASPYALRANFLKLPVADARILEIGPGHKPAFRGPHVRYFDVEDAAGLRARAERFNERNSKDTPDIHYVSPTGDLSVVDERFDIVYSSHAIEHQPDLVRHLQQVHALLDEGGVFMAIVPDRRFCFDQSIPGTTIGEVLEANLHRRRRHRIADLIDTYALHTHSDPPRHWRGDSPPVSPTAARVRLALDVLNGASGAYYDVHAWRFSSEEMREVLQLLKELELSPFSDARIFSTPYGTGEFCMILAR
jgi:SAM-dependent methyltransferase